MISGLEIKTHRGPSEIDDEIDDSDLEGDPLLEPVIKDGEIVPDFSIEDARQRTLEGIEELRSRDGLGFLGD